MKKYKVLRLVNGDLISPFQDYNYGKMEDALGKEMVCGSFDTDKDTECGKRFYATSIEGLIYSLNRNRDNRVFEVKMGGRSVINDIYKQGYEKQTITKILSKDEVKKLIREQSKKMDWDYYHACYPVNPLELNVQFDKNKALRLLKEWDSVRASVRASVGASVGDSVWASVGASVGDSVWASVWASVWDSVGDSVWDSVWAYISSLFPNIKKWEYIDHAEGVNPFQSGIDLWNMGLIPTFDGKIWRLHKGKRAEIVLEITQEEVGK